MYSSVSIPQPIRHTVFKTARPRETPSTTIASDDAELISGMLGGNEQAFRRIVEEHGDAVARIVTGMLGRSAEVDDVVQDVFIKLHAHLNTFRGDASLRTFVTRMAINQSLDVLRKRKRQRWIQSWGSPADLDHAGVAFEGPEPMESSDLDASLRRVLDTLPEKQRMVVVLRLVEGLSTEETAAMLGIKYGTVLSRLKRATDQLKDTLTRSGLHP